jgi:hypothetical protein
LPIIACQSIILFNYINVNCHYFIIWQPSGHVESLSTCPDNCGLLLFFAAGAVLLKKVACTYNYALATGNPKIAIERTLPSLPALKKNNQPTMVTQEDLTGSGGARELGKGR